MDDHGKVPVLCLFTCLPLWVSLVVLCVRSWACVWVELDDRFVAPESSEE